MNKGSKSYHIILLALVSCLLFVSACQNKNPSFPLLPGQPTVEAGQPSQEGTGEDEAGDIDAPVSLSLAVPFSEEAGQALALLFLARQNGTLDLDRADPVGHKLDLADLEHLAGQLELVVEQVPADSGLGLRQLALGQAASSLPDLFYCSSLAAWPGFDHVQPLDDLLYGNDLLQPQFFAVAALDSLRQADSLWAVPYLASTTLLVHDKELLAKYQLAVPPAEWNWAGWAAWLARTEKQLAARGASAAPEILDQLLEEPELEQELLAEAVFIYANLAGFLPYIAPSLSETAGWAMWDGYNLDLASPAFQSAAIFLRSQARSGFDPQHLQEEQLQQLGRKESEYILGQLQDSAQSLAWDLYTSSLMPAGSLVEPNEAKEVPRRLPARLRCLAVAKNSGSPQLAADLAAFIALDPDALLLQSRFGSYPGLFPLLKDDLVWQELLAGQPLLSRLKAELDQLYFAGQQTDSSWDVILEEAFLPGATAYLQAPGQQQHEALARIRAEVSRIRNEGG